MMIKSSVFPAFPLHAVLASCIVLAGPFVDSWPAVATEQHDAEASGLEAGWQHGVPALMSAAARESMQEEVLRNIISEYFTYLSSSEKSELPRIIIDASKKYGFDPLFAAGVIATESSFNNSAISPVGARGLMQVMPFVGEALCQEMGYEYAGVDTLHDPSINVELGLYYLRKMEARFEDLDLALAAYNMGPTLLERKMAQGFRPHGIYAGRVNSAYRTFQERALELHRQVYVEARL